MPITEIQRQARRNHLGSSDAPAVLGLSPWATPTDIYWSKTSELDPSKTTEAMQTGNRLEDPLIDFAIEREKLPGVRRNQNQIHESGILAANFDALVTGRPEAVEAKYVGPNSVGGWGIEGTDEVPSYVAAQCQHQMAVGDLEKVWVPAACAAFRLEWRMYFVDRDQRIIDAMVEVEIRFWNEHVLAKLPPDPHQPPSLEILKRLHRVPESIVELDEEAAIEIEKWQRSKDRQNRRAKLVKKRQAKILTLLKDAEGGRLPDGRLLAYLERHRKESYVKPYSYRVLQIQKG